MKFHYTKNDHFKEMGGWSQSLNRVSNSTLFYLTFDTYSSPWTLGTIRMSELSFFCILMLSSGLNIKVFPSI